MKRRSIAADRFAALVVGHGIAAHLALRLALHLDAAGLVVVNVVVLDIVADPIARAVAAEADARAGIAVALVGAEDIATAARVEAARLGVTLAGAAVALDHIAGRGFLDVDTLVALGVELVLVDPVLIRQVGLGGWVLAVAALLGRGADVDTFAVLPARPESEIVDTAVDNHRAADLVMLREIAQPNALTAGISEGHVEHPQPTDAIARLLAKHIQ